MQKVAYIGDILLTRRRRQLVGVCHHYSQTETFILRTKQQSRCHHSVKVKFNEKGLQIYEFQNINSINDAS